MSPALPDRDHRSGLRGLWLRYAVSVAAILCVLGVVVAVVERNLRESQRADAARDVIAHQVAQLHVIAQKAHEVSEHPGAAPLAEKLASEIARLERSRNCPLALAGALDAPPEVLRIYVGGPHPTLCEQADAFIAAARSVARGDHAASQAFGVFLLTTPTIRSGLLDIDDIYTRLAAEADARTRLSIRLGLVAVALAILAQALWAILPGRRMVLQAVAWRDRALALHRRSESELRGAMWTIAEAKRAVETADRLKTEFLARLSHEVRTPLNAVIGLADLMLHDGACETAQERLGLIRRNGLALARMMDDTIDVARALSGDLRLEPRAFDPRALAEAAIEGCAPEAARKGLACCAEISPDLPPRFIGDGERIGRLMRALLDNAVKFTREGGVTMRLDPWADGGLRLVVEDTGPGVPGPLRRAVFEPFGQLDGSATRVAGGLGQGLAYAKAVTQAMGGHIGVGEIEGGGARFWLLLPVLPLAPGRLAAASG